jgi:creatinine amidohydrolase
MKQKFLILALLCITSGLFGQNLSAAWEELTSEEFAKAVKLSEGVCIIPIGVIEKHGQHLPLGTDVFTSREISLRAASKEYALVFPFYFTGQINEAKHQPGTIAYSPEMLFKFLQESCDEISRNGIKKIIIMNGHGGNNSFLQYFCQSQLAAHRDYALFIYSPEVDPDTQKKISALRKSTTGGHADEVESSVMMYIKPELVKIERADSETGADLNRLGLKNAYTGIWWYGKYPNHYAGDAKGASAEIGELSVNQKVLQLSEVIKYIKSDETTLDLQNKFYKESENPLKTNPKR